MIASQSNLCIYVARSVLQTGEEELCCSTADKEVFGNVWSLRKKTSSSSSSSSSDSGDDSSSSTTEAVAVEGALLTQDEKEARSLLGSGGWEERCNPISGPTVFCVDLALLDARDGPFMLYSVAVEDTPTRPLYRCLSSSHDSSDGSGSMKDSTPGESSAASFELDSAASKPLQHFISVDSGCEGRGSMEKTLGHIAKSRGAEMLRALYRCKEAERGAETPVLR